MSALSLSPRGLLSLLWNGSKAIDVIQVAHQTGLFELIEGRSAPLSELARKLEAVPIRLYKLLDCLESLGLVEREPPFGEFLDASFRGAPGARDAVAAVVGDGSLERNRDGYAWRQLHGRLESVLRGSPGISQKDFSYPPSTAEQTATFEASMAAGLGPVVETFTRFRDVLWNPGGSRLLDVGGGDGALAAALTTGVPNLKVDVFNLPAVRPLFESRRAESVAPERLGFVAGNFMRDDLPSGYDALSFVRVLHDWHLDVAESILGKAYRALAQGGRLLICEEFRTPERLAIQFFWSYFLIGVDECVSRLREAEVYRQLLTRVGFGDVQILNGPFELIVATRT